MADDTSEDMDMAAFVGSYLGHNKMVPSSQEPERRAENNSLFCTPDREEEAEIVKPFNLDDVQGQEPLARNYLASTAKPLHTRHNGETVVGASESGTPLKRSKNSIREDQRILEETAVPSIERNEVALSKGNMGPPPKLSASTADIDAQTEFLRSLISKSTNVQRHQENPNAQNAPFASRPASVISQQSLVQIKREPRDDANLAAIPERVRLSASTSSKRSLSVVTLERTPPAKRIRLQELAHRKASLKIQAEEVGAKIENEKKAHEACIAHFEADRKAYEAIRAAQEVEFRQKEKQQLGEIQELENANRQLDQQLQRQRAVQQEQLAFWREERQQLGIGSEDGGSSVGDEVEESGPQRILDTSQSYHDGQDWP
ncbi:hypothetical protein K431DRAFT_343045 [Polychaeton citri CBS 116435]|uniref:Uncharacterized protein n=1 Tax=Polychaeton citri CBS 116435 TaxID=1314669 RepID=A0A9P4UT19_9PEZI|nr:hypothetical protein K431DRAFT_343045 [Polychaeton citri CBS 116435]